MHFVINQLKIVPVCIYMMYFTSVLCLVYEISIWLSFFIYFPIQILLLFDKVGCCAGSSIPFPSRKDRKSFVSFFFSFFSQYKNFSHIFYYHDGIRFSKRKKYRNCLASECIRNNDNKEVN